MEKWQAAVRSREGNIAAPKLPSSYPGPVLRQVLAAGDEAIGPCPHLDEATGRCCPRRGYDFPSLVTCLYCQLRSIQETYAITRVLIADLALPAVEVFLSHCP